MCSEAFKALGVQKVAVGAEAVSGILSAGGGFSEGAHYDANARMALHAAETQRIRGREEARRIREMTRRIVGSQRASAAGQGVAVDTGSALALQEETAYQGELDVNTVLHNAALAALGYEIEADNLSFRAKLARQTGFSKLFEGAAATYDAYKKYFPSEKVDDAPATHETFGGFNAPFDANLTPPWDKGK